MYRVILTGRSALKTMEGRSWSGGVYKLSVRDDSSKSEQGTVHQGLIYDALIDLDDPFGALRRATEVAGRIADELALVHGCWIEDPIPRFAIDWVEAKPDRDLVQVFHRLPKIYDPRRPFNPAWYHEVFYRMDRLGKGERKRARRIRRAMHYLRESMLEEDPLDRLEDLCEALEALEPELRKALEAHGTVPVKCPSCSGRLSCERCEEAATRKEPWTGTNHLIQEVREITRKDAAFLRRKRNALVHSFESREEILRDLPRAEEIARLLVQHGVLRLLEIPADSRSELAGAALRTAQPPKAVVRCTIPRLSLHEVQARPRFPQLKLRGIETVIQRQGDSRKEEKPLAAQLLVWMENHEGPWEPNSAAWWSGVGDGEEPDDIQLIVSRLPPPSQDV